MDARFYSFVTNTSSFSYFLIHWGIFSVQPSPNSNPTATVARALVEDVSAKNTHTRSNKDRGCRNQPTWSSTHDAGHTTAKGAAQALRQVRYRLQTVSLNPIHSLCTILFVGVFNYAWVAKAAAFKSKQASKHKRIAFGEISGSVLCRVLLPNTQALRLFSVVLQQSRQF